MDPLGKVIREYLRQAEEDKTHVAMSLAEELVAEAMDRSQVREMLYASGFNERTIKAVLGRFFTEKKG